MPKRRRSSKLRQFQKKPLQIFIAVLVIAFGLLIFVVLQQNSQIDKYKMLSKISNVACLGLSTAINGDYELNSANPHINATNQLYQSDEFNRTTGYHCGIGLITQAMTIHGKSIEGYEMGADVTYFKDPESAKNYAEKKINPLRYWGVGPEPEEGIPQTGLFTFFVSDGAIYSDPDRAIFDAYSVKGNALLRISLPCAFLGKNTTESFEACPGSMDDILKHFRFSTPELNF